jgi:hypothetical protein
MEFQHVMIKVADEGLTTVVLADLMWIEDCDFQDDDVVVKSLNNAGTGPTWEEPRITRCEVVYRPSTGELFKVDCGKYGLFPSGLTEASLIGGCEVIEEPRVGHPPYPANELIFWNTGWRGDQINGYPAEDHDPADDDAAYYKDQLRIMNRLH